MTCAGCGATLEVGALFCENCGTKVGGALGGAVAPTTLDVPVTATDEDSPISVPTAINAKAVVVSAPQTKTCTECGGTVGAEGYCDQCGTKAATERDHFREHPAPWLAGVCDRGIVHSRNEDAMALWADPASTATTGRGVLVVCDGVSSSKDSDLRTPSQLCRGHLFPGDEWTVGFRHRWQRHVSVAILKLRLSAMREKPLPPGRAVAFKPLPFRVTCSINADWLRKAQASSMNVIRSEGERPGASFAKRPRANVRPVLVTRACWRRSSSPSFFFFSTMTLGCLNSWM